MGISDSVPREIGDIAQIDGIFPAKMRAAPRSLFAWLPCCSANKQIAVATAPARDSPSLHNSRCSASTTRHVRPLRTSSPSDVVLVSSGTRKRKRLLDTSSGFETSTKIFPFNSAAGQLRQLFHHRQRHIATQTHKHHFQSSPHPRNRCFPTPLFQRSGPGRACRPLPASPFLLRAPVAPVSCPGLWPVPLRFLFSPRCPVPPVHLPINT